MGQEKWVFQRNSPAGGKVYHKGNKCLITYHSGRTVLFMDMQVPMSPATALVRLERTPGRRTIRHVKDY